MYTLGMHRKGRKKSTKKQKEQKMEPVKIHLLLHPLLQVKDATKDKYKLDVSSGCHNLSECTLTIASCKGVQT